MTEPLFNTNDDVVTAGVKVGCISSLITIVMMMMIPVVFLSWCIDAVVASYLWNWFLVPTFGFTALSISKSVGLVVTVRFIVGYNLEDHSNTYKKETALSQDLARIAGRLILAPAFLLASAWLFHRFFF
jgi:hypothetical protein